jgi:predicted ABC-type ATPase
MMNKFYMMIGVPGSGKSTVAATHELAVWQGFNIFPEYHEVGAYEVEEEK